MCRYGQLTEDELDNKGNVKYPSHTPVVNKESIQGSPASIVRVEGTGFLEKVGEGYTPVSHFRGSRSATVLSYTDTLIELKFEKGVPVTIANDDEVPKVTFEKGSIVLHAAQSDSFSFEGAKEIVIDEVEADFGCSFAGGCKYTIESEGLAEALDKTKDSNIEVCGNICALDAASSDARQAKCVLEPLITRYSANEFGLEESKPLQGKWTGSADDE